MRRKKNLSLVSEPRVAFLRTVCCMIFLLFPYAAADGANHDQDSASSSENSDSYSDFAQASNETEENECEVQLLQFLDFKMIFVGCIGTCIAVISIVHNALLFLTFVSSPLLRRRNLTYLTCLSLCDIVIAIFYIAIMSVQVYAEYFEVMSLYTLWHNHLNIAFAVSNVTFTIASFLLVCATFERYLQTIRSGAGVLLQWMSEHRAIGVMLSILGGIIFRGTIFFEIEIYHKPQCTGFASMGVTLSSLLLNPYYDFFRFWVRRIATIFVPFFVLAYCNAMIVYSLQANDRDRMIKTLILHMTMGHSGEITRLRSRVKAATRMLIMVVTCYLYANIIDVIIAFLEYTAPKILERFDGIYTVSTDVSSMLSILSSLVRLPIYIANDKLIRQEIRHQMCRICGYFGCCRIEKPLSFEKRNAILEQNELSPFSNQNSVSVNNNNTLRTTTDQQKRTGSGIGSLILARASVVSSTNAVNINVQKCTELYEQAMARHRNRTSLESSLPSDEMEQLVCYDPQGPFEEESFEPSSSGCAYALAEHGMFFVNEQCQNKQPYVKRSFDSSRHQLTTPSNSTRNSGVQSIVYLGKVKKNPDNLKTWSSVI